MRSKRQSRLMCASACGVVAVLCLVAACKREERGLRVDAPSSSRVNSKTLSELRPGNVQPVSAPNEFEQNAFAMNEGKRLFEWYNCVGCHAHGGGGIGPPLMDAKWSYGGAPEQIFATIVEGRPNGMPSFRGKIPDYQVWQLAAYVRSMSGQVSKDASPSRDDDMNVKKPEQSTEQQAPLGTGGVPKSAERPQ